MGVIGIEEILTALVNIDHLLGAFSWDPILTQAAKKFDVAFHDIKLFIHMKAALGHEYGCAGLRIWLHRVKDTTASMVYTPPVHRGI